MSIFLRGSQQIRTAVDGFADRYLATRSGNHFLLRLQRYNFFSKNAIYLSAFSFESLQFIDFSVLSTLLIPRNLQSTEQLAQADVESMFFSFL